MNRLPGSGEMPLTIAIDGHAHLRSCFDLAGALDHAAANLTGASDRPSLGVLLLAETAGCVPFQDLAALPGDRSGGWVIERTAEAESLVARNRTGTALVLVAGRQVVTRDRLEVLCLASTARVEDGLSVDAAIEAARDAGALVVLPWGFGKWWGRRGRIVRRVLESARPGELLVGDNGNRPHPGPTPRLFAVAEERGILVLPGSDPLPWPAQAARIGSCGAAVPGPLDPERPAAAIRTILRDRKAPLPAFGRHEGPIGFLRAQLRAQGSARGRSESP